MATMSSSAPTRQRDHQHDDERHRDQQAAQRLLVEALAEEAAQAGQAPELVGGVEVELVARREREAQRAGSDGHEHDDQRHPHGVWMGTPARPGKTECRER